MSLDVRIQSGQDDGGILVISHKENNLLEMW